MRALASLAFILTALGCTAAPVGTGGLDGDKNDENGEGVPNVTLEDFCQGLYAPLSSTFLSEANQAGCPVEGDPAAYLGAPAPDATLAEHQAWCLEHGEDVAEEALSARYDPLVTCAHSHSSDPQFAQASSWWWPFGGGEANAGETPTAKIKESCLCEMRGWDAARGCTSAMLNTVGKCALTAGLGTVILDCVLAGCSISITSLGAAPLAVFGGCMAGVIPYRTRQLLSCVAPVVQVAPRLCEACGTDPQGQQCHEVAENAARACDGMNEWALWLLDLVPEISMPIRAGCGIVDTVDQCRASE